MRALSDGLKVDIFRQLHVLGVNAQNFHSADLIWNTNIDLSVETTGTTKGWVNRVGSVGGSDDDDLASTLGTVHQSEQLCYDSLLSLTMTLLSVWRNRIDLIDEDDGWRVFLALFEGLPEVLLGLTRLGRHDLRTVQKEEEGTCQ